MCTESGMAAGSMEGRKAVGGGWAGVSHGMAAALNTPPRVLQLQGAPALEPGAGSPLLFQGSCAFMLPERCCSFSLLFSRLWKKHLFVGC